MSERASPLPRGAFSVFRPITTRWMDNDAYGHVNNVVYYSYFDTAVNAWLIENGHLFLAIPPLYRLTQGGTSVYARDDAHKANLLATQFNGKGKVEISRFKGLGEMPALQLKDTTMDPGKRTLLRVIVPDRYDAKTKSAARKTADLVESLMGRKPELRFAFIQENAKFVRDLDL